MPNYFEQALSSSLKTVYKEAIDALLNFGEVPCTLYFPPDKFEDCPQCLQSAIGGGGPNPFLSGGKGTYRNVNCSLCQGSNKRPVEKTSIINLVVIFDKKKFFNYGSAISSDTDAQTISRVDETHSSLIKCIHANLDNNTAHFNNTKFIRNNEPVPVGLGESTYLITDWKRAS